MELQLPILIILCLIFLETTFMLIARNFHAPRSSRRSKVFLDTSALIDGRILDVAKTNFLGYDLIISKSVLHELQLVADGKDNERRNRARLGLDVVNDLQKLDNVNVSIYEDELRRGEFVDDRLIELAKKTGSSICTCDFNLNKVATTEGIAVLNVNELAVALKDQHAPGERFRIKITGTGSNPFQGVGHLKDGTMVIVENAASRVNTEVDVEILRCLQTAAGYMAFAKITGHQSRRKKK